MPEDAAITELYGLHPSEFTRARDARAGEAKKAGDKERAAALRVLRRPSTSAWVVNVLARRRTDEISGLLELGDRMREAQAALSGDELRALGRQRHQLVASLAREGSRLARQAGHPVGTNVEREVEATLDAALADPDAGAAMASGLLVKPLEHSGLGPVDLEAAVATGPVEAPSRPGRTQAQGRRDREAQARVDATREADEADAAERDARSELSAASEELASAEHESDEAAARVWTLEEQLQAARERARAADVKRDEKAGAQRAASRRLEEARRRAEKAKARVTR